MSLIRLLLFVVILSSSSAYGREKTKERKVAVEAFVLDSFTLAPIGQIDIIVLDTMHKVIKCRRQCLDLYLSHSAIIM